MFNAIFKNATVGFVFGIVIAAVAYFGNYPIRSEYILIIPFIMALLTATGSLAAVLVIFYLASSKYMIGAKNLQAIGFIVATFVNTFLAVTIIWYFDDIFFHPEFLFLYIIGLVMGAVYGIYRYRVDLMNERVMFLEEISEKNRQLQEASRQMAIIRERNRMGRELHDSISQGLHGLVFAIHSLRNKLQEPSQDVLDTINHMEATARSTLEELRAMIEELKPSLLTEKGLAEALKTTAELFSQRSRIPVQFRFELPAALTPEMEMAVYRITQETLANIEKHASAQKVSLELTYDKDEVILNIKDDGKGFNPGDASLGHGLRNMRLRAEEVEGTVDIVSRPSLGTSLVARLPRKA